MLHQIPKFNEIQSKSDLDRKLSPFDKRRVKKLDDPVNKLDSHHKSTKHTNKNFGSMIDTTVSNNDLNSVKH